MTEPLDRDAVRTRLQSTIAAQRALPTPPARRAIRQAAGLSAADVARAVGVTRQAVGQWERGIRTPRGRLLELYGEALATMSGGVK